MGELPSATSAWTAVICSVAELSAILPLQGNSFTETPPTAVCKPKLDGHVPSPTLYLSYRHQDPRVWSI
ncbi:hypothetical protein PSPO01_00184 [Paraphaeosphaeria sporulosa]